MGPMAGGWGQKAASSDQVGGKFSEREGRLEGRSGRWRK